jgi:hypothetical protein
MAGSKAKFGFPLAIVLATASVAAVAQTAQTADAEFMRRVDAAAKAGCPQVDSAGRAYRWNTSDTSCATKEADGGLERPGVIAAVRINGKIRTTRVIPD